MHKLQEIAVIDIAIPSNWLSVPGLFVTMDYSCELGICEHTGEFEYRFEYYSSKDLQAMFINPTYKNALQSLVREKAIEQFYSHILKHKIG